MKTVSVDLYTFDELTDKAKERARDWYKTDYPDSGWWECAYDNAREAFAFFGVETSDMSFSGFWSQGDGASFTGDFRTSLISPAADLAAEFPTDETLRVLHARLTAINHPEDTRVTITRSGNYVHSHTMYMNDADEYSRDDERELLSILRSLANWLYGLLESEYDYLVSDECVDESILSNGYHFTIDGKRDARGDE